MQLISSWKNSLQLLKLENLKQLFRSMLTSLPQIYSNWFIYGLPTLALIAVTAFIYVK